MGAGGYSVPTPFRPPRAVPEMLCSARDFTVPKAYRGFWAASTYTTCGGSHLTLSATKQKTSPFGLVSRFGCSELFRCQLEIGLL